jgi:hypothetical protein
MALEGREDNGRFKKGNQYFNNGRASFTLCNRVMAIRRKIVNTWADEDKLNEIFAALFETATGDKGKAGDRVRAAQIFLEYTIGKAPQQHNVEIDDNRPAGVTYNDFRQAILDIRDPADKARLADKLRQLRLTHQEEENPNDSPDG